MSLIQTSVFPRTNKNNKKRSLKSNTELEASQEHERIVEEISKATAQQ